MIRILLPLLFFFLIPTRLLAATFIVDGASSVTNNNIFKADIYVDTENSKINALGGYVSYSGDKLILDDIRYGGSIVSLWLDEPTLEKTLNNRLEFNGLIPGGYEGSKAYLFSLLFKINGDISNIDPNDLGNIILSDLQIFLNDGLGTKIKLPNVIYKPRINIAILSETNENKAAVIGSYKETADKFPPEKFTPLVYNDPLEINNLYLAFSALDKGSGISHYEIAKNSKLTTNYQRLKWSVASSPWEIKDSDLRQYIYIKAIDRQGNFQVSVISPQVDNNFWSLPTIWVKIIIILLFISFFIYIIFRQVRKK